MPFGIKTSFCVSGMREASPMRLAHLSLIDLRVDWQHLFGRFREGQPRLPELDRRLQPGADWILKLLYQCT